MMPDPTLPQRLASAIAPTELVQQLLATQRTPAALLAHLRDAILVLLNGGEVAAVERAVQCAWLLAEQTTAPEAQALAHWCHGLALLNRETLPALEQLDAAYEFYHAHDRRPEQGRLLIGRAGLLGQLGRLEEAEVAITTAAHFLASAPAEQSRLPVLLLNRSDIEGRLGRYPAMLATAHEAAALALQYHQPANQAKALINYAAAALFVGTLTQAETALQQALAVAQACASPELCARALVNQARLATYRGELFAALRLLAQARAAFAAAQIDVDQATVAVEEASLYERLHLPHEARRAALAAAATFAPAGLVQECIEATLSAARLALGLAQPTQARHDLERAQALAAQSPPPLALAALLVGYTAHPRLQRTPEARRSALQQMAAATAQLAAAGLVAEQLELALLAAELGLALRLPAVAAQYRQLAELAHTHGLAGLEQRALVGLAGTLRPKAAWVPLQQAVALAAESRRLLHVEELKASYLSGLAPLYASLITTYRKAGRPDDAFRTLLEAKGSLWAELAAPTTAPDSAAPLPDPAWLRAKTEHHYWQEQAHPENEPAYQALCVAHIQQAEASLTTLARQQTRPRPAHPLPDLAALQRRLPPASVALEYLLDAEQLVACVISAVGPPRWVELGPLAPIVACLDKLALQRSAIERSATLEQQQRSADAQLPACQRWLAELGTRLLAPIEALVASPRRRKFVAIFLPRSARSARSARRPHCFRLRFVPDAQRSPIRQGLPAHASSAITRLIIAPDGLLFGVPWAALVIGDEYLDQRYELTLMPSLALLALPPPVAACGPPLALGYAGQPPLLQVPAELAALQRHYPAARCHNPARLSDLAWTEPPQILHFAMHGQVNPQAPLLSQLLLADGPLLLADVLNLRLHGTALVTLSACDTATTPERGGVALALAGAFLTAGAQAVLASLWPVQDAATCLMMEAFYAALAAGQRIPQALRQARAHVRAAGYLHPYYWAAFQPLLRG